VTSSDGQRSGERMGTRVQWQGTVPAGADAAKNFVIGAVPEGKKFFVAAASFYGGDAGERYGINLIPASQEVEDATVNADTGGIQWYYPLGGGTQTVNTPLSILAANTSSVNPIPGPCTLAISTVAASTAKVVVNMVGILEDL